MAALRPSLAAPLDTAILVVCAVLAWAAASRFAGPQVLTGRIETFAYLGRLLSDPDFLASA